MNFFKINKNKIGNKNETYFIADIAANHDGSLSKAKELIHMCAEAGANAAKFQNFFADTIVSDYGFKKLGSKFSHQSKWKKSVYDVYKSAEVPIAWTKTLRKTCQKYNVDYFTAPYDQNILNYLNKFMSAWKIGSGDIDWHDQILKIAKFNKPIIIATGASNLEEVKSIYKKVIKINKKLILMQCNTNYTASNDNFKYINLNVLKTFRKKFPKAILGLSDHTFGHETVLGAVTLGARVVEKHFTDNNKRLGPDHKFSMNPKTWREMIDATRNLENSLGNGVKKIEKNELQTVILQRRAFRYKSNFKNGTKISREDIIPLRPSPKNSIPLPKIEKIIGKKLKRNVVFHEHVKWNDFD